jgi:integrase
MDYNYSSVSKQNQIYSSIKLFAKYVLNIKNIENVILERPRKQKSFPKVIDNNYIKECLSKIKNTKHLAILSLGYSIGLRVSEVINLKIEDIDSKRMIIHTLILGY